MYSSLPDPSAISSLFIPNNSVNTVKLHFVNDGNITHVHLFPSQAHVTRWFKFPLKVGRNRIVISGLPGFLDENSIRVEGKGSGVIKEVMIHYMSNPSSTTKNALELSEHILRKQNEIKRKQKDIDALSAYISTMNANIVLPADIMGVIHDYNNANAIFDNELLQLNKDLAELQQELNIENRDVNDKEISVGILGDSEQEAELIVNYVTTQAFWTPVYDLHINTESEEHSIKVIYKASISQNTDEDWKDVHLILETFAPQYNLKIPNPSTWTLSFANTAPPNGSFFWPSGVTTYRQDPTVSNPFVFPKMDNKPAATLLRNSESANTIATFDIPDPILILEHSVTIITVAELRLSGELRRVSLPTTKDLGVYLTATVHNDSDYPLLKGSGNIYVNGTFTARSDIPVANPHERFDFSLGIDPSIRVIYHPREYKHTPPSARTPDSVHIMTINPVVMPPPNLFGKLQNTSNYSTHSFEQHITVINTKPCSANNVKIIDHIPISDDSTVTVRLLSPSLQFSSGHNGNAKVMVSEGVTAQWETGDDSNGDTNSKLGADGKISWNCTIPARGRVKLVLSWTVSAPASKVITGV